jgi:urea transport system permease protein
MSQFLSTLFNGLSLSSIILLTSLGLAITFGLMRVINMAHGEFVMIGAYMTFVVQEVFKSIFPSSYLSIYYFFAIIAAFVTTFIIGSALELFVISRLYGRETDSLLATGGISLVLQQLARTIFGSQGVNVNAPPFLTGGIRLFGITLSMNRLFIIFLVAMTLLAVYLLLYKTNFGMQMRAVIQNRPMAQCMGINTRKIDNLTFAIGSGLAGLAGASVALLGSVDATVGQSYIVNSFMAIVLGGAGRLMGTVLGSSIIGFASMGIERFTSSSIAKALVLIIIVVFLQRKPQGLFSVRRRELES